MSQAGWLVLCLKVALIAGFISLAGWVVLYSILADWYRSPIGRTLVAKTVLIALLFIPTTLALFFHLSRTGSWVAGWVQVGLIGLVTPGDVVALGGLAAAAPGREAGRGKPRRRGG